MAVNQYDASIENRTMDNGQQTTLAPDASKGVVYGQRSIVFWRGPYVKSL